jgi:tol-pal system protein YbgF
MEHRLIALAAALLAAAPLAGPAAAQDVGLTNRVGTLEKQMKAVQRKVFPGGDPRYFTPEITPEAPAPAAPQGVPATTPLADLTSRVDTLERQQATLTGAVEEAQNRLRLLDEAFAKYRGDTDFRLNAIEHPAAAAAPVADAAPAPPPVDRPAADRPAKPVAAKPAKTAAPLPVEDQWRAAYALYTAKQYGEAETAMTDFLAANPKAARASNAQYWLGRSYDAEGRHAEAAKAFLDGYKNYPDGERAPESLLWLGKSLTALKKNKQACSALDELQSVYGPKLTPAVKSAAGKARGDAKCDA